MKDEGADEVELRLLGELEVLVGGRELNLGGAKKRVLLATLALARGSAVPADAIAEELWGPQPGVDIPSGLQNLVSRLRRAVAPAGFAVTSRGGGYALDTGGARVDADVFEELAARGRDRLGQGAATAAAEDLRTALGLWRGPALAPVADRDFARAEAARLEELRAQTVEALADALLAVGRPADAAAVIEPLLAASPYREEAWARLILGRYRAGRQAEALAAYQELRRLLGEQLGLDPSAELRRLEQQMLAQSTDLDGPAAGSRPPAAPRHNLPAPADRILGREAELAELAGLLGDARLVTVWGPGGAGKTRLTLELAGRVLADFPDGVWFVELAPVNQPDRVPAAATSALGMLVGGASDPMDELARYLGPRRALLVLDNCEHLVGAVARMARFLMARCPQVRLLASSRERLGVPGEVLWPVPSLSLPGSADPAALAASDAVALFCERARAAHPAFALTGTNAAAVAEICRQLDGIPLALELAAARVRVLGVRGLAERLDARLGVLVGGDRTADPRHRTLRAAVDWSHDLLPAAERSLLAQLSVFVGDFDLAAAEAVAAAPGGTPGFEVLDLLARLVDKSLVVADDSPDGGVRYRLLETIRQYAAERLQPEDFGSARERHLRHYRGVVNGEGSRWWQDTWLANVLREERNVEAALEWCLTDGAAPAAMDLAAGLWGFWLLAERPGARAWLERALALPNRPRDAAAAEVLVAYAWATGSAAEAREGLELAAEFDDDELMVKLLVCAGNPEVAVSAEESDAMLGRALDICARRDLPTGSAVAHFTLAWLAVARDDLATAARHAETAAALTPVDGDISQLATQHLSTRAYVCALQGDADRAHVLSTKAEQVARSTPLPGVQLLALARSSAVAVFSGRWGRSATVLREQLALLQRLGTHRWAGEALEFTALALEATGRPAAAARVLGSAARLRAADGERPGGGIPAVAALIDACQGRLFHLGLMPDASSGDSASVGLDGALREAIQALAPPQPAPEGLR